MKPRPTVLNDTVTTFLASKQGRQLHSTRVLAHVAPRVGGRDLQDHSGPIHGPFSPVSVALCPTFQCIRQCSFCSNTARNHRGRQTGSEYTTATFEELSEDLNALGVLGVTLAGGGEPLACSSPGLDKFLALERPTFRIGVHTNGVFIQRLLTKPIIDSANMQYINISAVAHDPQLYERITGSAASQFQEIEDGLKLALELRASAEHFPEIGAKIIICRENYRHAHEIVEYFRNLGVENILLRCVGNFESTQNVELSDNEYDEFGEICRAQLQMTDEQILAVTGRNQGAPQIPSRCWMTALQISAGIYPDGEVYACTLWAQNQYSIGNVLTQRFSDLWGGERHLEVVQDLNEKLMSGECDPLRCRLYYSNLMTDEYLAGRHDAPSNNGPLDEQDYVRFI